MEKNIEWWQEEYGFFGKHYMDGDNSKDGYLIANKQTLTDRTLAETEGVIKLLALHPGARILDIPCGYGRHSISLAKHDYKIVGSDLNATFLEKAKKDAKSEGLNIDFKKENMISIKYDSEFDGVINMFYSFGFFKTEEDNLQVLRNFYNALKVNGKFLFHTDVNIPRILSGKYKENEVRQLVSGGQLRIIDKYDPTTKRINGCWIINRPNGNTERKDYSVRVYDSDEFVSLCESVGFNKIESFSDWSGKPYSEEAEDMIIVATK